MEASANKLIKNQPIYKKNHMNMDMTMIIRIIINIHNVEKLEKLMLHLLYRVKHQTMEIIVEIIAMVTIDGEVERVERLIHHRC